MPWISSGASNVRTLISEAFGEVDTWREANQIVGCFCWGHVGGKMCS